jgi:hypothetical protein
LATHPTLFSQPLFGPLGVVVAPRCPRKLKRGRERFPKISLARGKLFLSLLAFLFSNFVPGHYEVLRLSRGNRSEFYVDDSKMSTLKWLEP